MGKSWTVHLNGGPHRIELKGFLSPLAVHVDGRKVKQQLIREPAYRDLADYRARKELAVEWRFSVGEHACSITRRRQAWDGPAVPPAYEVVVAG